MIKIGDGTISQYTVYELLPTAYCLRISAETSAATWTSDTVLSDSKLW